MKITLQQIFDRILFACNGFEIFVEELNSINFFPVADHDTGNNMMETLKISLSQSNNNLNDLPKALIFNSKGNSGVILSQILAGFITSSIETNGLCCNEDIICAFKKAKEMAYNAVLKPKEGTMLTFIRVLSENCDKTQIRTSLVTAVKSALEQTLSYGEYDSGAKGLYYFFELTFQLGLPLDIKAPGRNSLDVEKLTYQYCTEALVLTNVDMKYIKEKMLELSEVGDSINYGFLDNKLKIHIHTNQPFTIFNSLKLMGELSWRKIDNMHLESGDKIPFAVIVDIDGYDNVFSDVQCEYLVPTNNDHTLILQYKLNSINYAENILFITDSPEEYDFSILRKPLEVIRSNGFISKYSICLCINTWSSEALMIEYMRIIAGICQGTTLFTKEQVEMWLARNPNGICFTNENNIAQLKCKNTKIFNTNNYYCVVVN